MEENHLKSRLKRKKSTVEASGGAPKRSPTPSSYNPAKTDGPMLPAGAWWNRQQLLAVESLWAFTLQAALPCLEEQLWDQVPDLPHASAAKPAGLWVEEQGWCDLSSEVSTFPEPSHLSLSTSQIPDPVGLSSSLEDPTAHTSAVPDPPVRGPSSHSMESSTHSPQTLSKTRRPSLHSWEEALPSPGSSRVGKEEGRKVTGPVSRKLPTYWVKVSDRVPLPNEIKAKKEEEVQGCGKKDGGGGAGGGLQSCPMCLQVFPAGFTQMDCDGHLAQCLSEMNVDMTW
ncbi:cholestanetriol 26-monooxygenase [Sarotherodon galilaeus]